MALDRRGARRRDLAGRAGPLRPGVARVEPLLSGGDVVLVGHGHALRALAAVWVGLEAHSGGIFTLEPASLSVLGHYQGHRVVERWNAA